MHLDDSLKQSHEIKRLTDMIEDKVLELMTGLSQLNLQQKAMISEIEELKQHQQDIIQSITTTHNLSIHRLQQHLTHIITSTLDESLSHHIHNQNERAQTLPSENTQSAFYTWLHRAKKQALTIAVTAVTTCCFVACGIFYFWPQHTHITYAHDRDQTRDLFIGSIVRENFDSLPEDVQDMIVGKITEKAKALGK